MTSFILSLRSEFYKTRKTSSFWIAIILPAVITGLVCFGFFNNSERFISNPPMVLWLRYLTPILGVMGPLLLPMFIIFLTYSVNNIEHRSEMWKSLFALPVNKWSIYGSKYVYTLLLNSLCLLLFATLIIATGNLLGFLKPELKFHQYSIAELVFQLHLKLFLSSLGILSIQFLMSLLWSDFLKPMGFGFIATIMGMITANVGWKYAYTIPYAHPLIAVRSIAAQGKSQSIDLMTKEIFVSLGVAVVAFVAGYFIVSKRSVK